MRLSRDFPFFLRGGSIPLAPAPAKVPKVGEPAEPPKGRVFRAPPRLGGHPLTPPKAILRLSFT